MVEMGMFKGARKLKEQKTKELSQFAPILSAYKIFESEKIASNIICEVIKIIANKRWLCLLQIKTPEKQEGYKEIYSVFQFISYCAIRTMTVPISIAFNDGAKYTEILEEFAGDKLVDLIKKNNLTKDQKEQVYWKVLYEGTNVISLLGGKMFHSNIGINSVLVKYHTLKFAFSCLGKLTPNGTIPKGAVLNIIDEETMAPELVKNVDGSMKVNIDGISSEKADVNSLGMCMVQLAGELGMMEGANLVIERRTKYDSFLKRVEGLKAKISEKLHCIIMRMLEEDPGKRVTANEILKFIDSEVLKKQETHEEKKLEMPKIGFAPSSKTLVLQRAKLDPDVELKYVRSDKTGSMFQVNAINGPLVLLKMYIANIEEAKKYEALFLSIDYYSKQGITRMIAKPMAYAYNLDECVFEWLDEHAGTTLETIRSAQRTEGTRFILGDLIHFFEEALNLLRDVKDVVFLSRVSRSSLLFNEGENGYEVRWCNFRFAYLIPENNGGKVPEGTQLSYFYKLTAAPEVINSIDDVTYIIKKEFRASPADLYALALVIVSLLCDMDALDQINLIEARCKSSECFIEMFKRARVPTPLADFLLKHCLAFSPEARSTPDVVFKELEAMRKAILAPQPPPTSALAPPGVIFEEGESVLCPVVNRTYVISKTKLLNRFKETIEEKYRKGGQGLIVKVTAKTEEGKQEVYALKLMDATKAQREEQDRIWAQVKEVKNCVKVYGTDYNATLGLYEVLMEFCERNLTDLKEEYIEKHAKFFPNAKLVNLFKQCIEAMACIQELCEKNIHFYHGDLNPKNILLKGEEVRIADFGCSKIAGLSTISKGVEIEGYTPLYAAPAILRKPEATMVDKQTYIKGDAFSLGMTFLDIASLWNDNDLRKFCEIWRTTGSTLQNQVDLINEGSDVVFSLKPILKNMLELDYVKRMDFKDILAKLP